MAFKANSKLAPSLQRAKIKFNNTCKSRSCLLGLANECFALWLLSGSSQWLRVSHAARGNLNLTVIQSAIWLVIILYDNYDFTMSYLRNTALNCHLVPEDRISFSLTFCDHRGKKKKKCCLHFEVTLTQQNICLSHPYRNSNLESLTNG